MERIPTAQEVGVKVSEALEPARERIHDLIEDTKPRWRGWLHLFTVPVVLIAGLTLTVLAPTPLSRLGAAIYTFTSLVLFGVSAIYHRGNGFWDRPTHLLLKRLDHANIYLLIGGSTTPFALLLLDSTPRTLLLSTMWAGCTVGVILKAFWTSFPRWLSTVFYMVLGWLPLAFIGEFAKASVEIGGMGIAALTLIATGGLFYTVGGVIYGLKRPNPWPNTFGYHEVFHLLTILAFICHYTAVSFVSYSAG